MVRLLAWVQIVTKDVGPYEIWAGNPARKIKDRFTKDIAEKLSESQWWSWPDSQIERSAHAFCNAEMFVKEAT